MGIHCTQLGNETVPTSPLINGETAEILRIFEFECNELDIGPGLGLNDDEIVMEKLLQK